VTVLLDTHALVWWLTGDRRLGPIARAAIADPATATWISAASIWEAAIKCAAGRLRLPRAPDKLLSDAALLDDGFHAIGIRTAHALRAGALPLHHRDPFDRMLIAQAQLEHLVIVTADTAFDDYDVKLLDARG
jgi:PIN domain nuclease of toxin-antitoxin system